MHIDNEDDHCMESSAKENETLSIEESKFK